VEARPLVSEKTERTQPDLRESWPRQRALWLRSSAVLDQRRLGDLGESRALGDEPADGGQENLRDSAETSR